LFNPWGAGIYRALLRQEAATAAHSKWITEWAPAHVSWSVASANFSLRNPDGAFYVILLIAAAALPLALWQRKLGAALLLAGAAVLAIQHIRFQALFAEVVVVVAGAVLASAFAGLSTRIKPARLGFEAAIALACLVVALACLRSADLVSNRSYLGSANLSTFGTGLSWWFPEAAAHFVERENVPGRIFNSYNEGGFIIWSLGSNYQDYIDGRAIPFGPELFERASHLMSSPPDSPDWAREAERYGINAIIVPLGRYYGVDLFPVLPRFCTSTTWRPVYLDEVSVVFVRRSPQSEDLIQRAEVDCAKAPLPRTPAPGRDSQAFNQWANAAAVLHALGRNSEAFVASSKALDIFPASGFLYFLRGNLWEEAGDFNHAEQEYLRSLTLEQNGSTWATLAHLYRRQGRLEETVSALQRAADFSTQPGPALLALGFANLEAHRPAEALAAFDRAGASMRDGAAPAGDASFAPRLDHGRAIAWAAAGDLKRAAAFEEEAVSLNPESFEEWIELGILYDGLGRSEDALRARERAASIAARENPPEEPH
jgi:Flp pilus assembly protein TadD